MAEKTIKHVCMKEAEITEIHTIVKDIYKELKGNGQPGLISEFKQFKGALAAGKWILGGGVGFSVVALIIAIIK